MPLDSFLAQYQHPGDIRIAAPFRNQFQYLEFALGESGRASSSEEPIDLRSRGRGAHLNKGAAGSGKLRCCGILITQLTQSPCHQDSSPCGFVRRSDVAPEAAGLTCMTECALQLSGGSR